MSLPNGNTPQEEETSRTSTPTPWQTIYHDNKGALLILISEIAGSSMDAIVRFLQQSSNGNKMHPFQVIFARMFLTWVLCMLYMYWTSVPNSPLGEKKIRGWLVLRAAFGFGGLFCLYYSVHYLPLAEATVFRFLVPVVTGWACYILLGQSFTRKEFLAGIVALIGVIIIAHPSSIFGSEASNINAQKAGAVDDVTPTQRLIAIIVSILGVFGASGAYTTIRIIGDRAHALISVTYFAFVASLFSALALIILPGISFTLPRSYLEWLLLSLLGFLGFVLQFLLTAGLQMDRSSKATSMLYTQVLFALGFDWGIWGVLPGGWSIFGGCIVIASTLWSALQKPSGKVERKEEVDEESALLGAQTEGGEEVVVRRGSAVP